jgi:hypothetical protein
MADATKQYLKDVANDAIEICEEILTELTERNDILSDDAVKHLLNKSQAAATCFATIVAAAGVQEELGE